MLQSTFQHIRGIGKSTELALWEKGVTDWYAYQKCNGNQLSLFKDLKVDPIDLSIEAYKNDNLAFFADTLSRSEFYRVALTYPEQTLFLDIETTGLSLYYDYLTIVGWSMGRAYGLFIKDGDESALREALKAAKAIVTFNGAIFDLKFLVKTFSDIYIPQVHIDLRFFARRAGLSGGQKKIESDIGFIRPNSVKGMEGEAAPLLWYKYRRGDTNALKDLVTYNHSDIEGMKYILDYSIEKVFDRENVPEAVRIKPYFSELKSKLTFKRKPSTTKKSVGIYLAPNSNHIKPLINFFELNRIVPLNEKIFIGIDLVSSEERESGYCILRGNHAETSRVKTGEEMIRMALAAKATLISIDSPLSIPKGRIGYFDDDPGRHEFGIMRVCERILKKRGVNVYPCLIQSMQKLTKRGIELAEKFRRLGIPVIESYPGAAQDILGIPRKRAGLEYLADALVEFGLEGEFSKTKISHDELDAITSSIVGLFFWTGKFEAIGDSDEEYLIIPDLNVNPKPWISKRVIGLSGKIGSGKSTVAANLVMLGCKGIRYSQALESCLRTKNERINRANLQRLGEEIYKSGRQRWLGNQLLQSVNGKDKIVVDGLRFPEDHALMVEKYGPCFSHIHIDASNEAIKDRIKGRAAENLDFAVSQQNFTETRIDDLKSLAHNAIANNTDIPQLISSIRKIAGV